MWLYSQSTGLLWDARKMIIATGYSGHGKGKNNPKHQAVPSLGPIPRGQYIIGDPYDSDNVGPYALPLTPTGHNALGRTDFLFHGENKNPPYGDSSLGCPIFTRSIRERIYGSNDKLLEVIE